MGRGLLTGLLSGADRALGRRVDLRLLRQQQQEAAQAAEAERQQRIADQLRMELVKYGVDPGEVSSSGDAMSRLAQFSREARQKSESDRLLQALPQLAPLLSGSTGNVMEIEDRIRGALGGNPELLLEPIVESEQRRRGEADAAKEESREDREIKNEYMRAQTENMRRRPEPEDQELVDLRKDLLRAQTEATKALAEDRREPDPEKPVRPSAKAIERVFEAGDAARAAEFASILSENPEEVGGIFGFGSEEKARTPLSLGRSQADREAAFFAGKPSNVVSEWKRRLDAAEKTGMSAEHASLVEQGFAPKVEGLVSLARDETKPIPPELQPLIDTSQNPEAAAEWIREQLNAGATADDIMKAVRSTLGTTAAGGG